MVFHYYEVKFYSYTMMFGVSKGNVSFLHISTILIEFFIVNINCFCVIMISYKSLFLVGFYCRFWSCFDLLSEEQSNNILDDVRAVNNFCQFCLLEDNLASIFCILKIKIHIKYLVLFCRIRSYVNEDFDIFGAREEFCFFTKE